MKKFFRGTLTSITALLLCFTATAPISNTLSVPDEETGIFTDTDLAIEDIYNGDANIQPMADDPEFDKNEAPLS